MAQPRPLRSATPVMEVSSDLPTYNVHFSVNPAVAMDVVTVKCPANMVLRVHQIIFTNLGQQTTGGNADMLFGYASNVGSGGTDHGPAHNYGEADGDPAANAGNRFGDTSLAPGFTAFGHLELFVPNSAKEQAPYDLQFHLGHKLPTVRGNHATINTFVIRHPGAAGGAGLRGYIEFTLERDDQ